MDEFLAAQQSLRTPGVSGWWVEVLGAIGEDRKASLLAAAGNPRISHRAISTVLGQWGFEVSAPQVGHWRRTHVG